MPAHIDVPGTLVISLDFELHWGVRDHTPVAGYQENLLGVRQAIPAMLELFGRYGIHATWATVGFLFFDTKAELLANLPTRRPEYADSHLSPYKEIDSIGESEQADPFHYGASLLRAIQATPRQEIATHTFSHYFCLEKGQTIPDFEADLEAAKRAAARFGVELKSLVFPRNQLDPAYVDACGRAGLVCYRGNQQSRFSSLYAASDTISDSNLIKRALRLADAYLPVTGLSARSLDDIADSGQPYDVPASRFLRPYSPALSWFEPLRLRRIEREMSRAAKRGLVYHLWWHPHNFGANTAANVAALDRLLRHFDKLRREHGMASRSMGEIADGLRASPVRKSSTTPTTVTA
jgi:hypothetical protein